MTNKQAVIAAIGIPGWQESAVCKALIDFDIAAADAYTKSSSLIINKAALQVLKGMLALASVQEGGYNIQYSVEGIKARIEDLEAIPGVDAAQPKIRNKSYLW